MHMKYQFRSFLVFNCFGKNEIRSGYLVSFNQEMSSVQIPVTARRHYLLHAVLLAPSSEMHDPETFEVIGYDRGVGRRHLK